MSKSLRSVLKTRERQYIMSKLFKYNGNKTKTAKALGIGISSLYRKMSELRIVWQK